MSEAGTRERLLESARYLFWERGYNGTGLNDVFERAGARSGSFYHFFKSKEDLLNEVLDTYISALHPVVVEPATRDVPDPIEKVFAILAGYRARLVDTNCTYGCPIGRLALEIDANSDAPRNLIARNFSAWTGAVERFLREASHRFPRGTDFAQLAQFILTIMEGAVMQSRAHRSIEPFDASITQLRHYLELLQAKRKPPRRKS